MLSWAGQITFLYYWNIFYFICNISHVYFLSEMHLFRYCIAWNRVLFSQYFSPAFFFLIIILPYFKTILIIYYSIPTGFINFHIFSQISYGSISKIHIYLYMVSLFHACGIFIHILTFLLI